MAVFQVSVPHQWHTSAHVRRHSALGLEQRKDGTATGEGSVSAAFMRRGSTSDRSSERSAVTPRRRGNETSAGDAASTQLCRLVGVNASNLLAGGKHLGDYYYMTDTERNQTDTIDDPASSRTIRERDSRRLPLTVTRGSTAEPYYNGYMSPVHVSNKFQTVYHGGSPTSEILTERVSVRPGLGDVKITANEALNAVPGYRNDAASDAVFTSLPRSGHPAAASAANQKPLAGTTSPRIASFGRSGQTAANGPKGATYNRRTCSTRTAAEKQDNARDAASTQTFPRDRSGVASSAKKSAFTGNRATPSVRNHTRPAPYANVHRAPSSSDGSKAGEKTAATRSTAAQRQVKDNARPTADDGGKNKNVNNSLSSNNNKKKKTPRRYDRGNEPLMSTHRASNTEAAGIAASVPHQWHTTAHVRRHSALGLEERNKHTSLSRNQNSIETKILYIIILLLCF